MKNKYNHTTINLILFFLVTVFTMCSKNNVSGNEATPTNGAGGSLAKYALVEDYLYIVNDSYLDVYNMNNPGSPVFKSSQLIGFSIETIYPYKDKLFIGSSTGMYVYSLNNPAVPVKEGAVAHIRSCDPVVANDSVAYVTLLQGVSCGGNQSVLNVYSIKTANKPTLVKTINVQSPYGLGIKQKALYVCEAENGLSVYDLADPYSPKKTTVITNETYIDVIPYGDILIAHIDKGVAFFDISNPLNVVKAGVLKN